MADPIKKNTPSKEKSRTSGLINGKISVHIKGFGFVARDDGLAEDIFIPKTAMKSAVDGDYVEVRLSDEAPSPKGPEGEVVTILRRGKTHIGAIVHQIPSSKELLAFAPLLGQQRPISIKLQKNGKIQTRDGVEHKIVLGDRLIVHITSWGEDEGSIQGEITDFIGNIEDPRFDVKAAAKEFDLPDTFSLQLIEEAKKFGKEVSLESLKGREDLTGLEIFTIDPATAKDFDDALSLSVDPEGNYHLGVHIADVSAYVKPGSALDVEARLRGNSTYFPGSVIPMLPEELSNGLCSLKPYETRLTCSIFMDFDKTGAIYSHRVARTFIKSAHRFTYEDAEDVLDKKVESPHFNTLSKMAELCQLLRQKRFDRGSVDIALTDTVIMVDDETGLPTHTLLVYYTITHKLVEEFMLKANEIVAVEISNRSGPMIYRSHEEPDPKAMKEFFEFAHLLGLPIPKNPTKNDLQKLFLDAKESPFFDQIAIRYIRSLKIAYYSSENMGHFGLMLEHYCHFTSPIRRYCDLVVHRLLFKEHSDDKDVAKISLQCSDRERNSMRAEMSVKLLKKLRLLRRWHVEEPTRSYKAIITKVKHFGIFFEVESLDLEGFIRVSDLKEGYLHYNEKYGTLTSDFGKRYKFSDEIELKLLSIDLIILEAKWELFTKSASKYEGEKRKKKKVKRKKPKS